MYQSKLNYLWFLLIAIFWGGVFVAIKFVITAFPPIFGAMLRLVVATLFLSFVFGATKKQLRLPINVCWKIWALGLTTIGLPFFFLFWGERFISPGLAGILNATVPIWSLVIALFIPKLKNSFSSKTYLGLGIGLIGIIIIFWPMLTVNFNSTYLMGSIAIIIMSICYASGAIAYQYIQSSKNKVNFYANLFHQHLSACVFLIVLSFSFESWPSLHSVLHAKSALYAVIYLGVFASALGWLLFFYLIQQWDTVRASSSTYISPILALLTDFLFFHNYPKVSEILGIVTILSGVLLIQSKPNKKSVAQEMPNNSANCNVT